MKLIKIFRKIIVIIIILNIIFKLLKIINLLIRILPKLLMSTVKDCSEDQVVYLIFRHFKQCKRNLRQHQAKIAQIIQIYYLTNPLI